MASIAFSDQWFANLSRYMEQLQADTLEAANNAVSYLHDKVVEKAHEIPEWSELADNIQVFSHDGMLFIGLQEEDRTSEAMALEYGDEVRPPSALFRSLSEDVREANQRWRDEMEAKGYVYGSGIVGSSLTS